MTPYEIFRIHRALTLHFNSDYDCIKYNFKVNVNYEQYKKRRDCVFYNRLYKKDIVVRDALNFILANILVDSDKYSWVGNLLSPEAEKNYFNFMKHKESGLYNFKNDLSKINKSVVDMITCDVNNNDNYPELFVYYLQGNCSIHTMAMINKITQFVPYWDRHIKDQYIWPEYKRKIEKYTQLLDIKNIQKYKTELTEHEQTILNTQI